MHVSTLTHIHIATLANSCCGFTVFAENQNKREAQRLHENTNLKKKKYNRDQVSLSWHENLFTNLHTEQIWSFAFTDSLIFCRHAPTSTQTLLPPPLIFFPSTRFQSPFCFLCHCSSLPSPPFASLTPTKFHSWR